MALEITSKDWELLRQVNPSIDVGVVWSPDGEHQYNPNNGENGHDDHHAGDRGYDGHS